MRVALNLLGLPRVDGGGTGVYSALLAQACAGSTDLGVRILCSRRVGEQISALAPTVEQHLTTRGGWARRRIELLRAAANPGRFGGARRRDAAAFSGCDVVHYPLAFMSGPAHGLPTVLTCGDLQHLVWPEFFGVRERMVRGSLWHRSLKAASRVIAYSAYARDLTVERLGIDPDCISVVALACHDAFYEPHDPSLAPQGSFIFYPAAPRPAKNHRRLLEAFRQLGSRHPEVRLVLSGPRLHDWAPVARLVSELGLGERVELRGHLPLGELHAYYARARGMIFPSLHEGFGLPVLEALAAGSPVAASSSTSLPELAGEAASYFDPSDIEAIAAAMDALLCLSSSERSARVEAGRGRAAEFGLERLARETAAVYRVAAGPELSRE